MDYDKIIELALSDEYPVEEALIAACAYSERFKDKVTAALSVYPNDNTRHSLRGALKGINKIPSNIALQILRAAHAQQRNSSAKRMISDKIAEIETSRDE
ncbi:MAG: hypothetical protein HYS98_05145 [Deltaproteobacteria bacterium]|nr:hypothetical protein [Deltaproteobacteria bacterium]